MYSLSVFCLEPVTTKLDLVYSVTKTASLSQKCLFVPHSSQNATDGTQLLDKYTCSSADPSLPSHPYAFSLGKTKKNADIQTLEMLSAQACRLKSLICILNTQK